MTAQKAAAASAAGVPVVAQNRTRAADIVARGQDALDWYNENKPAIFIGSSALSLLFAVLAYRRRASPEALYLWSVKSLLFAGLAYVARPQGTAVTSGEPTQPGIAASLPATLIAVIDDDVSKRSAANPAWENQAWQRLFSALGLNGNAAVQGLFGTN